MRLTAARRALTTLVVGLAVVLGGGATANADPTPSADPTPVVSAAPTTGSATATPTPTVDPSLTPSSAPSEVAAATPTPAERASTRTRLTVSQLRARIPQAARRILRDWPRSAERRAADDELAGLVLSSCGTGTADGGIDLSVVSDEDVRYEVNGPSGTRTGTITEADFGDASLKGLAQGGYRVRLYLGEDQTPVSETEVRVLGCLTVTASCQAATFTNPAGNPAVLVGYGPPDERPDDDAAGGGFVLAPGASHTERIRLGQVEWTAFDADILDPDPDATVVTFALAGVELLDVPQEGCGSPFQTAIVTRCSASATAPADVRVDVRHSQDDVRYELRRVPEGDADAGELVGSGTLGPAGTDTVSTTLPGVGDYLWLAYLGDDPLPYETLDVAVLRCVTTTVSCQRVTFANPKGNPRVTVGSYVPGGDGRERFVEVRGGRSRTVAVTAPEIGWLAVPTEQFGDLQAGDLEVTTLAGEAGALTVPVDCTPSGTGAGGSSGGDTDPAVLAATGSSPWSGGVALLGSGLLAAGALVLRRARRARRG